MKIIDKINLDLNSPNVPVTVYAKQNDNNARYIYASLYSGGAVFTPPDGTVAMFRELKPDGTICFYDSDEADAAAVVIAENVVQVKLVEQALTAVGKGYCEINLYNADGEKLTSFDFWLEIKPAAVTDTSIASTDYFNVLTQEISKVLSASTNPPYIGANGHWYVWDKDTSAFTDSGVIATGPQGSAATIAVGTTTTGAPGSQAQVTNVGTSEAAIFNFVIPQGEPGAGAVTSVNGQTGAVVLDAADVGAASAPVILSGTLSASNWTGSAAPYTQEVALAGILATDYPHITPVYSDTLATAVAEKEAWAAVSEADAGAGKITFTCFEDKPTVDISLQVEVLR